MFDTKFDFIIAQSIFSHTGEDASRRALDSFRGSLETNGLIVLNWKIGQEQQPFHPDTSEWVYPEVVPFKVERIQRIVAEAGLVIRRCYWPHPGLVWHVLAHSDEYLPDQSFLSALAVNPLTR